MNLRARKYLITEFGKLSKSKQKEVIDFINSLNIQENKFSKNDSFVIRNGEIIKRKRICGKAQILAKTRKKPVLTPNSAKSKVNLPAEKSKDIDISPIFITNDLLSEYQTGLKLRENKSIILEVTLDEESKQLYIVDDERFLMRNFGETRQELISVIFSDFEFCWEDYVVNQDNSELNDRARKIKKAMLEYFEKAD